MEKEKVFIIAEAGVNHNGSIEAAKKLVKAAADAGADAVKFQTFQADTLVTKSAKKAQYQMQISSEQESSQYQMLKALELKKEHYEELMDLCRQLDILFLSTPFDIESIEILNNLGLEIFKIPSGEITNLPYLREIGSLRKEVILSTGMSNLDEIEAALNVLKAAGTSLDMITILHANTEYPTPMEDVNLKAMETISERFKVKVGYSDHTQGIEVDIAAVALGAKVIEKHFTLDKTMEGPDHKTSLEPVELQTMIKAVRNIELALGDGVKVPSQSERKNIACVRKSIVAKKAITRGEIFSDENITTKRPGGGINPMKWDSVINTFAQKDYQIDDLI